MVKKEFNYYIDESKISSNKDLEIFLVGFVLFDDNKTNSKIINKIREDIESNIMFADSNTEKGFHACEDKIEVSNKVLEQLHHLHFRAYIKIFINSKKDENDLYTNAVVNISEILLKRRLFDKNTFNFEGRSNKRVKEKSDLEFLLKSVWNNLNKLKNIDNKIYLGVDVVNKDCEFIWMIDYVLKIVGNYFKDKEKNFYQKMFKVLEPKLGLLIINKNDLKDKYISPRNNNDVLF